MVLKSRVTAPDWTADGDKEKRAKCLNHPLPSREAGHTEDAFGDAYPESVSICLGEFDGKVCPFLYECLRVGLVNNEQAGTWGATLPVQRQWVRRNLPKQFWDNPGLLNAVPPVEEFFPEEEDAEEDPAPTEE